MPFTSPSFHLFMWRLPLFCSEVDKLIREFEIRDVRYVDYRVAIIGETAIRFFSNLAQKSIVAYFEFT